MFRGTHTHLQTHRLVHFLEGCSQMQKPQHDKSLELSVNPLMTACLREGYQSSQIKADTLQSLRECVVNDCLNKLQMASAESNIWPVRTGDITPVGYVSQTFCQSDSETGRRFILLTDDQTHTVCVCVCVCCQCYTTYNKPTYLWSVCSYRVGWYS